MTSCLWYFSLFSMINLISTYNAIRVLPQQYLPASPGAPPTIYLPWWGRSFFFRSLCFSFSLKIFICSFLQFFIRNHSLIHCFYLLVCLHHTPKHIRSLSWLKPRPRGKSEWSRWYCTLCRGPLDLLWWFCISVLAIVSHGLWPNLYMLVWVYIQNKILDSFSLQALTAWLLLLLIFLRMFILICMLSGAAADHWCAGFTLSCSCLCLNVQYNLKTSK